MNFSYINQIHDQIYHNSGYIPEELRGVNLLDYSCQICYPVTTSTSIEFQNFWNWFFELYELEHYLAIIVEAFEHYLREEDIQKQVDWLLLLREATRYSYYTPTPVQFLQEVQRAIDISENFSR